VEKYAAMLKEANANFQPVSEPKESIDLALKDLAEKKIISNRNGISVKKPDIIRYYANTIAHHLEYP
jgi:hypothetical protein